ncbi:MAG: fumarylacetoacetate hydrolase family protein, partial [Alphaproteobacteria bacterium]|nr:fumarylacetoacetate hydrolase family protein [Alphaproteobacteria bacterium]
MPRCWWSAGRPRASQCRSNWSDATERRLVAMRLGTYAPVDGARAGPPAWRAAAILPDDRIVDLARAAQALAARGQSHDDEARRLLEHGAETGTWLSPSGVALARDIVAAAHELPAETILSRRAVKLGPPVPKPRTFIAAGRNYMDHLREGQKIWAARGKKVEQASFTTAFIKLSSAITCDGDPILLPSGVDWVDYEIELVAVIGRRAYRVAERDALDHVAGYTICNDVGARRIQRAEMEHQIGIVMAKNFATFAPLGPWLVTADE